MTDHRGESKSSIIYIMENTPMSSPLFQFKAIDVTMVLDQQQPI